MINLFGEEQEDQKTPIGHYQIWRRHNNYRKAESESKCKNCVYCAGFGYHNKNYYKCKLQGESHSTASDIRVSYVCDYYNRAA